MSTFKREIGREGENAPLSMLRFDRYIPSQQPYKLLANREPEPSSPETSRCGRISLAECAKQLILLLRRHTYAGVLHAEPEAHFFVGYRINGNGKHHFTLLCKLDCIADKIDKYLAESQRISYEEVRHLGRDVNDQFNLLRTYSQRRNVGRFSKDLT